MKNVSIVIPSYKGVHLFKKNLDAVFKAARTGDQVIIVDDASGKDDDTITWFKDKFSAKKKNFTRFAADLYIGKYKKSKKNVEAVLLVNQENQRFGETSNRGVLYAKNELIYLINNDVAPHNGAIEALIPHFEDPQVFAVASMEIEKAINKKGGKNILWFERGMFLHNRAEDLEFGETAWATGGSAMFRKSMWLEIGGFDKLYYPAYWEDIDLSFQGRKRGWKILFEPASVVDHNHETTNQSVFGKKRIEKMGWVNAKKFTWKNGNLIQRISFLLWQPYWWIKRK
jgi:GT2 family glycosyltransferase